MKNDNYSIAKKADTFAAQANFEKASVLYKEMLMTHDNPLVQFKLGTCLAKTGNNEEALATFDKAEIGFLIQLQTGKTNCQDY